MVRRPEEVIGLASHGVLTYRNAAPWRETCITKSKQQGCNEAQTLVIGRIKHWDWLLKNFDTHYCEGNFTCEKYIFFANGDRGD